MKHNAFLVMAGAAGAVTAGCASAPEQARGFTPMRGVEVGKDWTFLTQDKARQVFIQLDKVPEGQPQIARLRYEERENQGTPSEPMLSARTEFEFNCYTGKFRKTQTVYFAKPNLKSAYPDFLGRQPRNWVKPEPRSIASAAYDVACNTRVAETASPRTVR